MRSKTASSLLTVFQARSKTISGLLTVFQKELADIFTSWRFIILLLIVFGVGISAIVVDAQFIREVAGQAAEATSAIFLLLFTTSGQAWPIFIFFIIFIIPVVGIILGFDTINSEQNSGTMSRLLSQPIYRDSVINGKFLAGVVTIAIMLTSLVMIVGGIGIKMIGIAPTSEEIVRLLFFLIISIIYGAFWLGIAMLFSIFFRRVATSALASIAVWLLFGFIFLLPQFVRFGQGQLGAAIMQISPMTLFGQVITILLVPEARTLGLVSPSEAAWMIPNPLSLGQSLLVVWPNLMSLVMLTVVCFAISYIRFMRQEIRST